MIETPMDVLKLYPVRKNRKQKDSFRNAVVPYFASCGYDVTIEKGKMGAKNVVIGNPETAKFLVTAHYDTPAGLLLPNLVTPCCFITFAAYQALLTLVILLVALIPVLLLAAMGVSIRNAGRIWLLGVYAILAWMFIGPANKNNANDNTSGVVTVLEIAKSIPERCKNNVCFILFDLEEAGLIGSASYRKKHKKQTENQIVLNLDCVGDGNEIVFFPTKKLKSDQEKMGIIRAITGVWGKKSICIREHGFAYYPSDQKNFPYGVGIAAFNRSKWAGLYCGRIHTNKDTILERTNVNLLRAAIVSLIACNAVN